MWEVADASGILKTSCHKILTKNLGMQNVATKYVPSQTNKQKTEASWSQSRTFWPCKQWWKLYKKYHYRWQGVGLWLQCRNKSPVFKMGLKNVTQTQKVSLVKCEADVESSFLLCRCCSPWSFTSWPVCQQIVLPWSDEMSARGCEITKSQFMEGKKMDAPPWQCLHTFITYSYLSPKARDHTHPTNSVLARPCTSRLLFVPEAAIYTEGRCFESVKNPVSGVLGVEWTSSKETRRSNT